MKTAKNRSLLLIYIVTVFINCACDFTPKLNKDIFQAQKYIEQQDYSKAIKLYEEILNRNLSPEIKVKVYYQLGELYSTYLTNNKMALKYFRMIKGETSDPLWLVKVEEKIGELNYLYEKNFEKSIKSYQVLMKFTPKLKRYDFYEYRLALSYYNGHHFDEAIQCFDNIISNKNHEFYVMAFYHMGMIYFEKQDLPKSIFYWTEYIKREKIKSNIVNAKFYIANAYETMELLKEAYDMYYSILGSYPNTQLIKNRLSSIYSRKVARKR